MSKGNVMNTYGRYDIVFEKGCGCKIYDIDGNEYIDFVSGVAVNCLGHGHPIITKALTEQSQNLVHISNYYWNTKQIELSEKLCSLSGNHNQVFFCNSGTEAVEAALKLARKYGRKTSEDKNEIIYMENSFHGRSMGALSVTGQEKYQKNFRPLITGVKSVKFNDIEEFKSTINKNTCAVILEPIQGEGGIINADVEYLNEVRKLCDRNDTLLIFDEVQCGVGRTGRFFAYQKFGVIPDIICMAKGLAGGFPIGAVVANEKSGNAFVPGDHGSTFGGNPLACAVSLAVINELVDCGILDSVDDKSKYIIDKLSLLKEKYSIIDSIQGKGLMLGIKFTVTAKKVANKAFEKRFLVAGAGENVVRLLPPLNVTLEEIDQALEKLEETIASIDN